MKPRIKKLGTIDCDLVETNPVVFKDRLYRFEYVRPGYAYNDTGDAYYRFVDHETGEPTPAFGHGYHMGCAYVEGDTAYVTTVDTWDGEIIDIFASKDLENWESWNALTLPGYGMFNTSLCKTDDNYVLMFEVGKPPEIAGHRFTARFATSTDLKNWELTPPEYTYSKDRYTAPHCLRYLDGYFYDFYLEAHEGYEQRVVRSRDLIDWEPSPYDPVLKADDDDRQIANPRLTEAECQRIAEAVNINNSDIDFCEFEGQVIITYSWGSQKGVEHLAEAVYEGTLREFLTGWYPED
jgi:hypothetical protein